MRLLNLQHWAVKAPRGGAWVRRLGWGKGQSRLPGIPVSSCFVSLCSPRLFRVNDPEDLEAPEGSRECPWTVTCLCPKQGVGAVGRDVLGRQRVYIVRWNAYRTSRLADAGLQGALSFTPCI